MPHPREIQAMFGAIAPRYDMLNRVLSLGTDRAWRRRTCELLEAGPTDLAADLCCGTGDLSLDLERTGATVIAADFSPEMLTLAGSKGVARTTAADCLQLPFIDRAFDLVTVAFGVRNLADLDAGLVEMHRVLRPGGRLGILEFARPDGALFRTVYDIYLTWIVPSLGALLSGRRSAYTYLSTSIRNFPDQQRMKARLVRAGFTDVHHSDFFRGIAALYIARRPA